MKDNKIHYGKAYKKQFFVVAGRKYKEFLEKPQNDK